MSVVDSLNILAEIGPNPYPSIIPPLLLLGIGVGVAAFGIQKAIPNRKWRLVCWLALVIAVILIAPFIIGWLFVALELIE